MNKQLLLSLKIYDNDRGHDILGDITEYSSEKLTVEYLTIYLHICKP